MPVWIHNLRAGVAMLAVCTFLLGGIYPLVCTALLQLLFANAAQGTLIMRDGVVIGSELLGQSFTSARYFWGRASALNPAYNAQNSGGSNFSPANPLQAEAARTRASLLREADKKNNAMIPVDLVTASASGLDPHISMEAAQYQAARIAKARHMKEDDVQAIIRDHAESAGNGLLGNSYVNVLKLNLALDDVSPAAKEK